MAGAEAGPRVCKGSPPFGQPACLPLPTLTHKTTVAKAVAAKCQTPLCKWVAARGRQRLGQGFRLGRTRYLQVARWGGVPKALGGRGAMELPLCWGPRVADEAARAGTSNLPHGMAGQRWVELLTSSGAESAGPLLRDGCGAKSRPDRVVTKADAVGARGRMEANCAVVGQTELRPRHMAESEAANARMEDRMEAKRLAMQEANKDKLVKMDGMPLLPQPLSGETMPTPVQLGRHKVAG